MCDVFPTKVYKEVVPTAVHPSNKSKLLEIQAQANVFPIIGYIRNKKIYYCCREWTEKRINNFLYTGSEASKPKSKSIESDCYRWTNVKNRLKLSINTKKNKCDLRLAFMWNEHHFLVKNLFTFGFREVKNMTEHIFQLTKSPLILFIRGDDTMQGCWDRGFDPNHESLFDPLLMERDCNYRLTAGTMYMIVAPCFAYFTIHVVPAGQSLPFNCHIPKALKTTTKKIYCKDYQPPQTPYIKDFLLQNEKVMMQEEEIMKPPETPYITEFMVQEEKVPPEDFVMQEGVQNAIEMKEDRQNAMETFSLEKKMSMALWEPPLRNLPAEEEEQPMLLDQDSEQLVESPEINEQQISCQEQRLPAMKEQQLVLYRNTSPIIESPVTENQAIYHGQPLVKSAINEQHPVFYREQQVTSLPDFTNFALGLHHQSQMILPVIQEKDLVFPENKIDFSDNFMDFSLDYNFINYLMHPNYLKHPYTNFNRQHFANYYHRMTENIYLQMLDPPQIEPLNLCIRDIQNNLTQNPQAEIDSAVNYYENHPEQLDHYNIKSVLS